MALAPTKWPRKIASTTLSKPFITMMSVMGSTLVRNTRPGEACRKRLSSDCPEDITDSSNHISIAMGACITTNEMLRG
jgi:hypothetical protein